MVTDGGCSPYFTLAGVISELGFQRRYFSFQEADDFFIVHLNASCLSLRHFSKVDSATQGSGFLNGGFSFLRTTTIKKSYG